MLNLIKKFFKCILIQISRIIFLITPEEFKNKEIKTLKSKLRDNLIEETFQHFNKHIKKSLIFTNTWKIREYAIKTALLNDINKEFYYLEFGVWKGSTANFFSKYVKKLYVFDSFEGLSEDWPGKAYPKYYYNLNKKIPKLNSNIKPIVGWVEDTLENFLKDHKPRIKFVHFDMDLYAPTKFTLEKLKPYLEKDAILIFDELYNFIGWEEGEYKALNEVFKEDEYRYRAFNIGASNSVIQIK